MAIEIQSIPPAHNQFLENAVRILRQDERIVGISVSGSLAESKADAFSDVDLAIAVEPAFHPAVMAERQDIACRLGSLVASFTGEHVGEPRLLVCLYDQPLLHVDLKFVALPDAVPVVDTPVVIWERGGQLTAVAKGRIGAYPAPKAQWLEDRFWVWIHYLAGKIARGELFEALEGISFLRVTVLAPLGLAATGLSSSGVRRVEKKSPALAAALTATVAEYDRASLWEALDAAIALYRELRTKQVGDIVPRTEAEEAVMRYFKETRERFTETGGTTCK